MPNDPSSQPTQPLTDAQYAAASVLIVEMSSPLSWGPEVNELANVGRRLLAEVDRLRAENTAQAEQLAAVRAIDPRQRTGLTMPTLLAEVSGWNGAVAAMRSALGLDQDGSSNG